MRKVSSNHESEFYYIFSIGAGAFSNGNTAVRRSPIKFNSGNFSLRMTGNRRRRADNKDGRKSTIVNEETAEADANENIPKSEPIDEPPKRRKRRRSSLAFDQSSCPGVSRVVHLRSQVISRIRRSDRFHCSDRSSGGASWTRDPFVLWPRTAAIDRVITESADTITSPRRKASYYLDLYNPTRLYATTIPNGHLQPNQRTIILLHPS